MRITSGKFKNRLVKTPSGTITHPMGDRERLALFNALTAHIMPPEATTGPLSNVNAVLDLYSGSGALGLEALSRGAKSAVFIDKDKQATEVTKQNIDNFGLKGCTKVYKMSVNQALLSPEIISKQYDLILIDPPYNLFDSSDFKDAAKLLTNDGMLVLSYPKVADGKEVKPQEIFPELKVVSDKAYAAANIAIMAFPGM
ncbi:RsmD family RNA methyltransferase [Candidatus Saccharibacteria bacterium]|nr:RsmD family RNA methyltransferase [Candidatus Saccharibacteria bacterium]